MKNFIIKSLSILSFGIISTSAFAERNINVKEACEQYSLDAVSPLTEFTFDIRNYSAEADAVSEHFKCTFYKGYASYPKFYYKSSEDRDNKKNPLKFVGVFAMLLPEFYEDPETIGKEYKNFFQTCRLKAEDTGIGIFSIKSHKFDPIHTAFALQNSEWFTEVLPVVWKGDSNELFDEKHDCFVVCSSVEECRKTDPPK